MDIDVNKQLLGMLLENNQRIGAEIDALRDAGREDEANLLKAARNIHGQYEALQRQGVPSMEALAMLDEQRRQWLQARALAHTHGDFAHVAIEDAKLAALEDIEKMYQPDTKKGEEK